MADEPESGRGGPPRGGVADVSEPIEAEELVDFEELSSPELRPAAPPRPPRLSSPAGTESAALGGPAPRAVPKPAAAPSAKAASKPAASRATSSRASASEANAFSARESTPSPREVSAAKAQPSASRLEQLCRAQLESESDPARKARLHYELGRHHEAGDRRKAAEHYQLALSFAPDHVAAIRGARRARQALGEHLALPALFDAEVVVTREPAARARLLEQKARIYERELSQPALALATYHEALALDPGNLTILKGIERGHRRNDDFAALAATYLELASAVEDAPLRAAWTSMAAHLTEVRLGNPSQAAALYESALSIDPHSAPSLAHVKRLGTTHGRWHSLVQALRKEHELCHDPEARQAILRSIAHVEETHLGDAKAATATIESALRVRPDDRSLLRELVRLETATGGAPVAALARLAELTTEGGDELASIAHRIGRLFEQELSDLGRARPWYERALVADPTHGASALALMRLYEGQEAWSELLRVLAMRAHAIATASERAELFHRMGTLLDEKLRQPADAAAQHAYALGLDPSHHEAFRALERLYAAAGAWRELAELYGRAIDHAPHPEAIAWLTRLGGVLEDRVGDLDGALAAYARILERDPKHLGALHAVARTAERAGRFDQVIVALRTEARLTADPARRDALLHRAAMITADPLGDAAGAMLALEQILAVTPQHRASLESLAELASKAGQWAKAVAIQTRILPLLATPREQARLHHRIGETQAAQLGQDVAAIESFGRALALDADLEPARGARIAALERTRNWQGLAAALEERLARLAAPGDRARAATELGALYEERLGDRALALASYERAVHSLPLHRPALDARERLLTDARDSKRLAEALSAEAAQSEDEFERLQASLRAALVLVEQQGTAALAAFRPVFTARPGHVGALLAVEDAYGRASDEAGLAATYERLYEATESRKAKLAALEELACARTASDSDAAPVHQRILALAKDDAVALDVLAASARRAGDTDTELAMRARLATGASDPSVAAYHHSRIAELHLTRNDPQAALLAFRAALGAEPSSLGATEGLTRAARAARDPAAMREAARYETLVTRDRETAVALLREAARLFFEADREDDAAACYTEALSLAPDDPESAAGVMATMTRASLVSHLVEVLSRAAQAATDPSRASTLHLCIAFYQAEVRLDLTAAVVSARRALAARPKHLVALASLTKYLERNAQWTDAAESLEELIVRTSGAARVDAHLRLASIAEKHLAEPNRAMDQLRTVLAEDEDNAQALTALVRLERVKGNDEEALALAKKLITVVSDEEQQAAAYAELAELEKKRGQIAEAAQAAYWAMGVLGPLGSAGRLYRTLIASSPSHASWDNYTSALLGYLERAKQKGGDLASGYRELARVLTEAQERPDRAISALREGTQVLPLDTSIGLALVGALRQSGADEEALKELRRLATVDVLEVGVWRLLAEVLPRSGATDGASIALAPVVLLGQANDDEMRAVRARASRPAAAPTSILSESGLKRLVEAWVLEETPTAFIPGLLEVITKIEGIDYERWGVNKRDRIRAGDPHPLRAYADRIGRIFGGVPEYDLFVSVASLKRPFILAGSPPALLAPAGLEGAREAVLAFHLARPLALLSRQLHPLDHIDDGTMERILVAGVRQFDPRFKLDPIQDEQEIEIEVKRVKNAIGFFSRSRIQEAASAFVASPPADYPAWAREVRRLAARAALLISDDLIATLEALGETLGPDNYASDLARFWVSDPAIRFRRAVMQQG